jgi:hypothetical protein
MQFFNSFIETSKKKRLMELYSLKDLDNKLLSTRLLKNEKGQERLHKSLDRHHYIVHLIISKLISRKDDGFSKFVNLKGKMLQDYLGRNYKEVIDNLIKIEAIEVNPKYQANKFSKSYRIHPNWSNPIVPVKVALKSKFFKKKLEEKQKNEADEILNDALLAKILKHTQNLFLIDEAMSFLPPRDSKSELKEWIPNTGIKMNFVEYFNNPQRVFRYEEFRKNLLLLNSNLTIEQLVALSIYYKPVKAPSGRIYHFVSSIPRKIRKGLRTKDLSLIYEVDMASAQPTILMLEWLKWLHKNDNLDSNIEAKMCKELILKGGIYDYVKDNSSYFESLEYGDLKTKILTTLNDKDYTSEAREELIRLFPEFMKFIRKMKQEYGHKEVSKIGQTTEAKIFIKTYEELDETIFALPIHDCILTTKEHLSFVKDQLVQKTKEIYKEIIPESENLDKVFKTSLVSINNEKLSTKNWVKYVMEKGEDRDYYMNDYYARDYESLDKLIDL